MWNFLFSLLENKQDKRRRLSVFAVEDIVSKLLGPLIFSEIDRLIIVSHIKSKAILYALSRKLYFYGFKIFGHIKEFTNPHNGVKKRKLKRK